MEKAYDNKMSQLGYTQLVCDIFTKWENVKDEILIPERKTGTGNGTIHVFLGAADENLRKEFASYYASVEAGGDTAEGAIEIKHYFSISNIISMLGYVCKFYYDKGEDSTKTILGSLNELQHYTDEAGLFSTKSLFKLSIGSNKLRPYFKQFENNGVFAKLVRNILLPNSSYKISLYKNEEGEYAAYWLIGFDGQNSFDIDSNAEYLIEENEHTNKYEQLELQKIYYGAPGTGKSHKIKKLLEDTNVVKENIFRTTFHPDSDYSTFVGAYKPTMKKQYRYEGRGIATYPVKDDLAHEEAGAKIIDKVIHYDFVPQAFINAYVRSYQTEDNVYLIIEEINRGNCAQIFGDLFQLLDRDANGVSDYTIKADADLRAYLEEVLGKDSEGIKDGELCLPSNMYILATMNTSDQSLFPIDSAFKRRWDWEYEPIKYKNTDWTIEIAGNRFSWTSFQEKVNNKIFDATNSEDKMLGDYFVKPADNVITEKLLLNKVLFYLWNDVCKDGDGDIFRTAENKEIKFSELYGMDGTKMLLSMMKHLNVKLFSKPSNDTDELDEDTGEAEEENNSTQYSINGETTDTNGKSWGKGAIVKRAVEIYCENHPQETAAEIRDAWMNVGFKIPHIVETTVEKDQRLTGSKDKTGRARAKEVKLQNGESVFVSTEVGNDKIRDNFGDFLTKIQSKPEWGINIQEL